MKNASFLKNILHAALLAVTVCALPALAGTDNVGLGTGRNGPLTVTAADTIINAYAQVTGPLGPGDTAIMVSSTAGFSAGQLVMVHQTTGIVPEPPTGSAGPIDLSNDPVGRWELARLSGAGANTLSLSAPLIYSYAANVTQIVSVPEYTDFTVDVGGSVTVPGWNGSVGGILAFLATGTVQLEGDLVVDGKGLRGGRYVQDTTNSTACTLPDQAAPAGAQKGEGIAVTRYGTGSTGRGHVTNGGGGGVCVRSGGGGGGNAGAGGQGGNTDSTLDPTLGRAVGGTGGVALVYSSVNHLTLGGGGGAGHGTTTGTRGGGAGGGIIFIRANALQGGGSMGASGAQGDNITGLSAANGGGAGGTVYLRFVTIADCAALVQGGAGGNTNAAARFVGPGGGGGGGRALLQATTGSCIVDVAGANSGQTATPPPGGDSRYGAQGGANGSFLRLPGGFPLLVAPVVVTPANNSSTNATPTYMGTLTTPFPAGTLVSVIVDGAVVGTATPDASGNWSFTTTNPLGAGPHTVQAVAFNTGEGVESVPSNTNAFTVDLTAPTVEVTAPAEGARINTPLPVYSGTVSDNGPGPLTVEVSVDGTVLGNATVTGNTWTFTPTTPLAQGQHTVTAKATDVAGNTASDSNTFTVDLTAPTVAVTAPAEGAQINTTLPVYSGTVSDNGPGPLTVEVSVDGTVLGNATVTGNTWTFTPTTPLAQGQHTVTAKATDVAGNTASDSNTFTVDLTAPMVAVTSPAEGARINTTLPVYSGTVSDNGPGPVTVEVTVDGVLLGNATVTGNTWTFTPTTPLAQGPHTVMAKATDAAGNTASDINAFTVDTQAPSAPVVTTPSNNSTISDNTPTYRGMAEPGSLVTVIVDGVVVGTTTTGSNGIWEFTPVAGLTNGQHTVKATATDAAGNVSPESNTNTFTVDATIPAAPVVTGPPNDSVTNDTTPTISGTAPANSTVTVFLNGTQVGTTTADAAGNWTFTPTTPLPDGPYAVTATATNTAGNISPPSNTVRFTVDTVVPDTTIVSGPSGTVESTSATFDFSSNEADVTYECSLDGGDYLPCTDPVTFEGLAAGDHSLRVRARDGAGNVDPTPAEATWTVVPPTPAATDRDFLGDGVGCAASGGDPSTLAMMALALLSVLAVRRRRQ